MYNRAVNNSGGALYCVLVSDCIVVKSTFELNTAHSRGGAVYTKEMSEVSITSSKFTSNMAERGGALAARQSGAFYILDISFFSNNSDLS